MPVTPVSTKPVRATVTVPGRAELEFSAKRSDGDAPVVVLYSVMDGAAVRITEGATQVATVGRRATAVRHTLGFGWTENPTPLVFQVRGMVTEDGAPQFARVWRIRVQSTTASAVQRAMESIDTDEGFVPLPDDVETILEEVAARNAAKRKRATRKRAAAKKKGTAKKSGAKKTSAKKSGAKKAGAKKRATKKTATKTRATKKAATKKRTAKRAPARKKTTRKRSR